MATARTTLLAWRLCLPTSHILIIYWFSHTNNVIVQRQLRSSSATPLLDIESQASHPCTVHMLVSPRPSARSSLSTRYGLPGEDDKPIVPGLELHCRRALLAGS
ncbi:hypothetical protein BDW72DRAFT_137494 [Aspergillus terricola var. indicus]